MKNSENILKKTKISLKQASFALGKFLLGVIFSQASLGSIYPFGIAFAGSNGIFGALGAIAGYIINKEDSFRYSLAVIVNFAAKLYLDKAITLNTEIRAFLYALWSVLVAGVAGIFVVESTFTENCLFIFGGIVSGIFAYVFSVTSQSFSGIKKLNSTLRFIFLCVFTSSALLGLLSFGQLFEYAALTLTYFFLFCVCARCGLYVSVTAATLAGTTFLLHSTEYLPLLGSLILGAVGAGLLRSFGKYPVMLSFVISSALMTIVTEGSFNVFKMSLNVFFAGILYVAAPTNVVKKMTDFIVSDIKIPGSGIRKKKKKMILNKINDQNGRFCNGCKNRIMCWVTNYSETIDFFNQLKSNSGNPYYEPPGHFKNSCVKYDEIVKAMRPSKKEEAAFSVETVYASLPKKSEKTCGDTCTSFKTTDGRTIFCIADGMGSGALAERQSTKASKMLQKLLEQGLDKSDALRLLNDTLVRSETETIMGLDIALFNESSGLCEFIKAGAAPSYIIRGDAYYEIGSASLPVGILDNVSVNKSRCNLIRGDAVIMVSDGIYSDRKWLLNTLSLIEIKEHDPVSLTEFIMKEAEKEHLTDCDDISVLVFFVY